MMICPKCGHETTGNFCSNCGAVLSPENGWLDDDFLFLDEDGGEGSQIEWKSRAQMEAANGHRQETVNRFQREREPEEEKRARKKESVSKTVKKKEVTKKDDKKESRREIRKEEKREALREKKEERRDELSKQRKAKFQEDRDSENSRRGRSRTGRIGQGEEWEGDYGRGRRYDAEGEEYIVQESSDSSLGKMAVKGAVGVIVLSSRVMQLLSCFLMAVMVLTMARAFLGGAEGLGNIQMIVEEENYGLGLYLGFAGLSLGMGVIWCLWILSRKAGGGEIRLKKFDTGRGFIPFMLCAAAVILAEMAAPFIPASAEAWRGLAGGASAALTAVNSHHDFLFFCSGLGFILSLIRKILRV